MSELRKKPRKLRVERRTSGDSGIHAEESWAVSYADMLMVLLAFFVVFFSIDNKSEKDDLIDLLSGKKAAAGDREKAGGNVVEQVRVGDKVGQAAEGLEGLQKFVMKLPGFETETRVEGRKLILHFPENIYGPGKYMLTGDMMKSLDEVIDRLKPYQAGVDVAFVGHTDEKQLRASRGRTLANNFDLSSLRASRALQRAIEMGIKPATLSAQGGAEFSRNTRSLTIVVSLKREDP
ncbi:MAG: hypothetical protein KF767_18655 [Bdellovibrionaceae bacterium]|nr:hypothetical protein [Pseudobdellovibrionaceae bacterium]